jgi:hypothetical protein
VRELELAGVEHDAERGGFAGRAGHRGPLSCGAHRSARVRTIRAVPRVSQADAAIR